MVSAKLDKPKFVLSKGIDDNEQRCSYPLKLLNSDGLVDEEPGQG